MEIVSVRDNPEFKNLAIKYFKKKWGNKNTDMLYEDCITHSIHAKMSLPQWYLLMNGDEIIGGAGLITNDFISRMDLYPWLCALFIEEQHRGHSYGSLLIEKVKEDAKKGGFSNLYLYTDHVGYYERYGFVKVGRGYHPWGASSDIYQLEL